MSLDSCSLVSSPIGDVPKKMILLTKLEELDLYSHKCLMHFPKVEKFLLCAEIRQTISYIIKGVIRAGKKYYRKTTLEDIDILIEYLRVLIRKSFNLGYITSKRYGIWSKHIDEIGCIVGAWIKKLGQNS